VPLSIDGRLFPPRRTAAPRAAGQLDPRPV